MANKELQSPQKWQMRAVVVTSAYRIVALAIGTVEMLSNPIIFNSIFPYVPSPPVFISILGLYTLLISFYVFYTRFRYRSEVIIYILLFADIVLSIWVLISTGGLQSPFLLLTIAPVLTAALFLDIWVAIGTSLFSGAYTLGIELVNSAPLSFYNMHQFTVYVILICLIASLPFLLNVNVREHLKHSNILQERQRLSHELHDGDAQTAAVLRWKIQALQRHLAEKGIDLDEVKEVERLAEKAQWEIRESLELLRNYTGDGSFLPHLKDYINHLEQETEMKFHLSVPDDGLHLDTVTELELLRICQEALLNIKNHAEAQNVKVLVQPIDSHLKVNISDDGRGFDILSFYNEDTRFKGHGLAVMNERSQSVGGRFRVLSFPGQGTEIQIEVPLGNSYGKH